MLIILLWILLALIPGYVARGKGNSFLVFFLLSLVLSPLIGLIIALVVPSKAVGKDGVRLASNFPVSVADEISKLKRLRDEGILSPAEFESKKQQLLG